MAHKYQSCLLNEWINEQMRILIFPMMTTGGGGGAAIALLLSCTYADLPTE